VIVSLVSLVLGCVVSFVLGLVFLVSGYVGYRSVRILVTVKKQVVAAGIVTQVLG
jgi:hypothetical protein